MKKEETSSGNAEKKTIDTIKSEMEDQKIDTNKVKGGRTFKTEPELGGTNSTSAG